jgi:hypothetical protein
MSKLPFLITWYQGVYDFNMICHWWSNLCHLVKAVWPKFPHWKVVLVPYFPILILQKQGIQTSLLEWGIPTCTIWQLLFGNFCRKQLPFSTIYLFVRSSTYINIVLHIFVLYFDLQSNIMQFILLLRLFQCWPLGALWFGSYVCLPCFHHF